MKKKYIKIRPFLIYDHNQKLWCVGMYMPSLDAWYIFEGYGYHYSFNGIYNYLKAPHTEEGKNTLLKMLKVYFEKHRYYENDIEFLYKHDNKNFYSGFEEMSEYEKFEIDFEG